MDDRDFLRKRLSEFRCRQTGKDPFGPLTDLQQLAKGLSPAQQTIFEELLEALSSDEFWKDFIRMFRDGTESHSH